MSEVSRHGGAVPTALGPGKSKFPDLFRPNLQIHTATGPFSRAPQNPGFPSKSPGRQTARSRAPAPARREPRRQARRDASIPPRPSRRLAAGRRRRPRIAVPRNPAQGRWDCATGRGRGDAVPTALGPGKSKFPDLFRPNLQIHTATGPFSRAPQNPEFPSKSPGRQTARSRALELIPSAGCLPPLQYIFVCICMYVCIYIYIFHGDMLQWAACR